MSAAYTLESLTNDMSWTPDCFPQKFVEANDGDLVPKDYTESELCTVVFDKESKVKILDDVKIIMPEGTTFREMMDRLIRAYATPLPVEQAKKVRSLYFNPERDFDQEYPDLTKVPSYTLLGNHIYFEGFDYDKESKTWEIMYGS